MKNGTTRSIPKMLSKFTIALCLLNAFFFATSSIAENTGGAGEPNRPGGTLPPMPGFDDLVLEPYSGQNVAGAVRFGWNPIVSTVTGIFVRENGNLINLMPGFSDFSPAKNGFCYRFSCAGRKQMIFRGVNAIGQKMESELEFTVVGEGEQSIYCTHNEGGRVFANTKPETTVWTPKNEPEPDIDDISHWPSSSTGGGKYFASYRARFERNIMRTDLSPTETSHIIFIELQRIAKLFGASHGSFFDKARAEGQSIADKRGYSNTPCAEVQSSVLRRVFERAGVSSNFEGTPLVTDLNKILAKMGWIVWDPKIYYPTPGAIGMHTNGISPSHTYLIAGLPENDSHKVPGIGQDFGEYANGRYILDNADGSGRDLLQISPRIIANQYNTGGFWLPPGIIPAKRKK